MAKAWIEMLHRYFAMAVGILTIVIAGASWLQRRRGGASPWLATAILGVICVQGAFGAATVTQKLQPAFVTLHLLGGITVLALLAWLALELGSAPRDLARTAARRSHAVGAITLLVVQIALGGWVSSNYAVLACPDFPLCHGALMPDDMNFAQGFSLWRDLGQSADGAPIAFQSLVAIHWTHRTFSVVVALVLGWLAWRLLQAPATHRLGRGLVLLLVLQFATGILNVILAWPLALAVVHNGGAALLVVLLVAINHRLARAKTVADGSESPAKIAVPLRS
jgi:cytochrome c oxidase assembly protein subunit 15